MTLPFFPPPYFDELFAHECARFVNILGYPYEHPAVRLLFGPTRRVVSIDLPSGLSTFLESLPFGHTYTVNRLCYERTLYLYYAHFLSELRQEILKKQMTSQNGGAIHSGSGIMASWVPLPTYVRMCPDCIIVDRKQVGEAYFHRSHQLPSSKVCHIHGSNLQNTPLPYHQKRTRYALHTAEIILANHSLSASTISFSDAVRRDLLFLAQEGHWLLQQKHPLFLSPHEWNKRYRQLLIERGLITYTGQIRKKALIAAFQERFSPPFLALLHSEIDSDSDDSWLLRLLRQPKRFHHPTWHLLVILFLEKSVADLVAYQPETNYFGQGPWPCLNHTCLHFNELIIADYHLSYSRDSCRPIGQFTCASCQMIYARIGPDQSPDDIWRVSYFVEFGAHWEKTLTQLWLDESYSLRALAKHMGVDTNTVKKHALRLGLDFPRSSHRQGEKPKELTGYYRNSKTPRSFKIELTQRRHKWLLTIEEYSVFNLNELRQLVPDTFIWLYRHDKLWLDEHIPKHNVQIRVDLRVNWPHRDIFIAIRCLKACIELLSSSEHPRRLTKTAISRHALVNALVEKHANKVPFSMGVISRQIESREEYAIRRIQWITWQLHLEERSLPVWKLIRRTGTARIKDKPSINEVLVNAYTWLCLPKIVRGKAFDYKKSEFLFFIHLVVTITFEQGNS